MNEKTGSFALARLDGLPDERFPCPEHLDSSENHMTELGEHVAVYEAQCSRNGNGGFNGEDGFPLCCACGGELSEHSISARGEA